jgi:hypothetical protein
MVWGNRPSYVVFGIVVGGFTLSSFGGCSDGESKGRPQCGPGETRVCIQRGVEENCSCQGTGTAGTGPTLDGGGGRSGTLGSGGAAGTSGASGSGGSRPIIDGALGSGGSSGSGATGGSAGSGGTTAPGTGRLGAACSSNVDCATGLTCILPTSAALGGEGPARGLCTASCASDAASCSQFGNDAVCLEFGTSLSSAAYCVQGCTFGPAGAGRNPNKCQGRNEVACGPLFAATTTTCTVDANCGAGQLCDGVCYVVIPACLPQCNVDADCGAGRYCNPQTGLCRATPQPGLPLGQVCTQPAPGGTDPCRGTCIGIVPTSGSTPTTYTCAESCTLGVATSCNWAGPASGTPAPGFCLFSSTVIETGGGPSLGDRGSCAQLCNCNTDCLNSSFVCIPIGDPTIEMSTRRRGFCTLPQGNPGIPNCTP